MERGLAMFHSPPTSVYASKPWNGMPSFCRLRAPARPEGPAPISAIEPRVVALVEERDRGALDAALWTMAGGEFIPHSGPTDPVHVQARSPIHIASEVSASNGATVLVNLRVGLPAGYERFARVIEVVTGDENDRAHARERWKSYKAQGIEPQRHDLQLAPQD